LKLNDLVKYAVTVLLLSFDRGSFQFVPQPSFYLFTFLHFLCSSILLSMTVWRMMLIPGLTC